MHTLMAFKFNSNTNYKTGGAYSRQLIAGNLTTLMIDVGPNKVFFADMLDIWKEYRLPKVTTNVTTQNWNNVPMQFWQNQLNFAVWCATTGCGVSFQDHLTATEPLMQGVYLFHTYYTVRRILTEMKATLPQDDAWNPISNSYDRRAYERLCSEFGVSPRADWRQKVFPNSNGLGDVHTKGHVAWRQTDFRGDGPDKHIQSQNAGNLVETKMTFGVEVSGGRQCSVSSCDWLPPKKAHIDFIQQDAGVDGAWSTFVLDKSLGFTQAGIERLNGSIRTYVWAVLGAQAQTKAQIVSSEVSTQFDAQKQFIALVEDAISSPVDLPQAIKRYQDVLQYAGSQVDYVFGNGLYMAPSDMLMRVGQAVGYNNEIVIAAGSLPLGHNDVNGVADKLETHGSFSENKIAGPPTSGGSTPADPLPAIDATHEEQKRALIVGSIVIGLLGLWFGTSG